MTLKLPLFPNYVFVNIAPGERGRVLGTPSVIAMIGNGREPTALADGEVELLRSGLGQRGAEPHPYLTEGRRARIRCGPLQGLEGVVVGRKNASHRVRLVLTLDAIRSSVAVEVGAAELELIGPASS